MWGKSYLDSYHLRAQATYNKNVDKMQSIFAAIYNPILRQAWSTSNFKEGKKAYTSILEFIRSCVPELEELVLTISGTNISIVREVEDIMQGWFLDHKKHKTRHQQFEQIASILLYEEAFVNSFPNRVQNPQDGIPINVLKTTKNHYEGTIQLKCSAASSEDTVHTTDQDFATTLEGSTTLQVTTTCGSQSSNDSMHDTRNIQLLTPSSSPVQKWLKRTTLVIFKLFLVILL